MHTLDGSSFLIYSIYTAATSKMNLLKTFLKNLKITLKTKNSRTARRLETSRYPLTLEIRRKTNPMKSQRKKIRMTRRNLLELQMQKIRNRASRYFLFHGVRKRWSMTWKVTKKKRENPKRRVNLLIKKQMILKMSRRTQTIKRGCFRMRFRLNLCLNKT